MVFLSLALLALVSVVPLPGNYKIYTVLSGSMEPALKVGSVIVTVPDSNYKVGDIITYKPSSYSKTTVTHRISAIKNDGDIIAYAAKGDANNAADSQLVVPAMITGKTVFTIPYAGYLLVALRRPYVVLTFIWTLAAMIIGSEIKKIHLALKKQVKAGCNYEK
ncbi:MAG: signal peptidase I [Kiritimatiellae bacterium]|nr:signal peptidase I [Kiritimatiellia bacterium]